MDIQTVAVVRPSARWRVVAASVALGFVVVANVGGDAAAAAPAAGATVDRWIARDALTFAGESPEAFDAAMDRVIKTLGGSVELLGFGEALHGGEQILLLRNRLFERLVTKYGYRAIALESSFARSRFADDYIAGRGPTSYEDVADKGFSSGVGRLAANRELVEWMRAYNADPAHSVKLRIYGFDIPSGVVGIASPRPALSFALDYLAGIDAAAAKEHRQKIESLLPEDALWENPLAWVDTKKAVGLSPEVTALRIATEDLLTELRTRRPELVARSDEDRYREALQYALVARQVLNFHAAIARQSGEPKAGPRGVRDALMADNLQYILDREHGRGKVLVFAHNGHLQRGKSTWPCCGQKYSGTDVFTWWPAGAQLQHMLGTRYAVIGSAVGYSAENGLAAPEPGSLEARLTAGKTDGLLIPTHNGSGLDSQELAGLPVRSGSLKNLTYTALVPQSFTDFDWLCVLRSVTYSRGGAPLQNWDSK